MSQLTTPMPTKPESYRIRIAPTADGGGDRIPDLSPREARERWLNKRRSSRTESTISTYHYRTKLFIEWCEEEGIDSIGDLTGWDLESYENHRRSEDLAPLTLHKEMMTLEDFLKYCANIELVDESLPGKVDPPGVPDDAKADETMLEPERAKQLLKYYRTTPEERGSRAHALLSLTWYTGARLGGIRGLDLEDYYADEQYVMFRNRPETDTRLKKGDSGERPVPLPEEVCDTLDEYIAENRHDVVDDHGRQPLLTSTVGRPGQNTVRTWMYLATVPCLHTDCPHGEDPETCDYLEYAHASKCPSSRSPHQVRSGAITWQRHKGVPIEDIAENVNSSPRVIEMHYDKPDPVEKMEKRRRQHLDRLDFEEDEAGEEGGNR